jgi:hypothetical protein
MEYARQDVWNVEEVNFAYHIVDQKMTARNVEEPLFVSMGDVDVFV